MLLIRLRGTSERGIYTHSVTDINLYCTLSRYLFDHFVEYLADKRERKSAYLE